MRIALGLQYDGSPYSGWQTQINHNTVQDELEKAIKTELKKEQEPVQLSLFSEDERTQLRRDTAALETRLARIPNERILETQSIETRYGNFVDRTFPVAVVFFIPESITKGVQI